MKIRFKSKSELVEQQIIDQFRDAQDNQLPSEEELCRLTGVSRTTVRAALVQLEKKGIINKKDRVGSFFLNSVLETRDRMESYLDFIQMIQDAGHEPALTTRVMGTVDPSELPGLRLPLEEGEQLLYFIWDYHAGDVLAFRAHYYVPEHLFTKLPPDRTYRGKKIRTCIFGRYAGQDYSHFIATLRIKCHEETNLAFGLDADTKSIGFDEYMYNYQDRPFAFSSNYVNPDLFGFNMVNIWR